jgi:hypothetical protein
VPKQAHSRIAILKFVKDLPEVVESHQPIIDALKNGRGKEASVLLRNHVETLVEYFKKADSDSGVHRAFRKDLEGAKDVLRHSAARHQQALEVVERILAEVSNFANGEPQRDDVTLVVMKVREEREV